jgi:hypothetical protein
MVIKYSATELIAIGEMVILKECISRIPSQTQHHETEPQYQQVYVPSSQDTFTTQKTSSSSSISADNFLQDFAQFQHNLDQSIQLNRDINWQSEVHKTQQEQQQKLTNSVAEFFKKAQQNFHPNPNSSQPDSSSTRARRLSEVEAELLVQLRGHVHL